MTQIAAATSDQGLVRPERSTDDAFWDLVCAEDDWLRAEFDTIVTREYPGRRLPDRPPAPRWPAPGAAVPPAGPRARRPVPAVAPLRRPPRQRSPPAHQPTPIDARR